MDDEAAQQIAAIARRYYLDDRPKTEIAREFGLSRFRVARLLEQGREAGIITITINDPNAHLVTLQDSLSELLQIPTTVVSGEGGESTTRRRIAQSLARLLRSRLQTGDTFGISWGRTMLALSEQLPDLPPSSVVQLTGTVGDDLSQSPLEVLSKIAADSNVTAHPIFAPMYVASNDTAQSLRDEPSVASTLGRFKELDLVAASIGSWQPPITQLRQYFSGEDARLLDSEGAVAELLGIFVDAQGRVVGRELDGRRIAATSEDLRGAAHSLAGAGGTAKAPAILAIARSGLITHLVTDEHAALEMLHIGGSNA